MNTLFQDILIGKHYYHPHQAVIVSVRRLSSIENRSYFFLLQNLRCLAMKPFLYVLNDICIRMSCFFLFSVQSNTRFPPGLQSGLDRYVTPRSSTRDNNPGNFQQQQLFDNNPSFIPPQLDSLDQQQRFAPYQIESNRFREASPPSQASANKSDSFVFNVEGLSSPSWNCERLFNLLCLYGNVLRVKFLKSKEGGAMVQMNHCDNLRQHLKSLNSTFIFGQTFIIVYVIESQIFIRFFFV